MPKICLADLRALLAAEKADALSAMSASRLSSERSRALDYYLGDMSRDMPAPEGRSRAVSSDVADTIEGLMPTLMDIFCGGDEVVRFEPVGPEDVAAAEADCNQLSPAPSGRAGAAADFLPACDHHPCPLLAVGNGRTHGPCDPNSLAGLRLRIGAADIVGDIVIRVQHQAGILHACCRAAGPAHVGVNSDGESRDLGAVRGAGFPALVVRGSGRGGRK